tara:strand:+ start:1541 stop:2572 length:1032 start_codon:yes stop_codon:yes gene_type:complete
MTKKNNRRFNISDIRKKNFFKTFIVAEIGINHDGKISKCKRLINEACKAGADAVKLQTINPDESYFRNTSSYRAFENKDFSIEELIKIKKYAEKKKLIIFSTPGDISSLNKIFKAGFRLVKISSGLCTNIPLIEEVSRKKIPMILSTGMTHLSEIKKSVESVQKFKNVCVGILKCTSLYPAPDKLINLNSMISLKKYFKIPVGLSDHSLDDLSSCASVAMGASIIEKHLTLNKKAKGADHKISLNPNEFKTMVKKIRRIEEILGSKKISPTKEEIKKKDNMQRYIFSLENINVGQKINLKNISFKRSNFKKNNALKAEMFNKFKNYRIRKKIKKDTLIKTFHF